MKVEEEFTFLDFVEDGRQSKTRVKQRDVIGEIFLIKEYDNIREPITRKEAEKRYIPVP